MSKYDRRDDRTLDCVEAFEAEARHWRPTPDAIWRRLCAMVDADAKALAEADAKAAREAREDVLLALGGATRVVRPDDEE